MDVIRWTGQPQITLGRGTQPGLSTLTLGLPTLTAEQRARFSQFDVEWRAVGESTWQSTSTPASSSTVTLPQELAVGSYEIRVRGKSSDGTATSQYTGVLTATVQAIGKQNRKWSGFASCYHFKNRFMFTLVPIFGVCNVVMLKSASYVMHCFIFLMPSFLVHNMSLASLYLWRKVELICHIIMYDFRVSLMEPVLINWLCSSLPRSNPLSSNTVKTSTLILHRVGLAENIQSMKTISAH